MRWACRYPHPGKRIEYDTKLYRHLRGKVKLWTVEHVELNAKERRVDVWVGHPRRIAAPLDGSYLVVEGVGERAPSATQSSKRS